MNISGWPLSGGWLIGVWLVELWMQLMGAPMWGRVRAGEPFCEKTNAWAEKFVVPRQFFPVDAARTRALLEADPQALRTVLKAMPTEESASHAELVLHPCAGMDAYASITNVHVTVGKKGQVERKLERVVEYLHLADTNVDALIADLGAQALVAPGAGCDADAGPRIAPELAAALEHLEAERYGEAVETAAAHVSSEDAALRPDARRICALACSRLGRWQSAARYFGMLFEDEPSAHNALQLATSSVMAGALAGGLRWMNTALALNAVSREVPHLALLTGFVTALKQAGQPAEAMPFIEQIRQAYIDTGSTDPTALYLRSMPFFSVFLNNSLHFVRSSLEPEQGRRWYAHMLPSLDPDGRSALNEWLEAEFGPAPEQA
jgi:tetratricopeptide (TPR) repeat protein